MKRFFLCAVLALIPGVLEAQCNGGQNPIGPPPTVSAGLQQCKPAPAPPPQPSPQTDPGPLPKAPVSQVDPGPGPSVWIAEARRQLALQMAILAALASR